MWCLCVRRPGPGSPSPCRRFGGPAGQIAVMQRALVDEKRWLGQRRFLHALNYCMLLPGPEAQQLAIYTGWLLNGTLGGAGRRGPVRAAGAPGHAGAVGDVRRLRRHLVRGRGVPRAGAGRGRDRGPGSGEGQPTRAHPSEPGGGRGRRVRRAHVLRRAVPVGRPRGGCAGRVAVPGLAGPHAAGGRRRRRTAAPHRRRPFAQRVTGPARALVTLVVGLIFWFAPVAVAAAVVRSRQRVRRPGLVLLRRGGGDVRRRLRRVVLRRPAGRLGLRLAVTDRDGRTDSPWPRRPRGR